MTPALEFLNVAHSYKKGRPVLDGVTFSIEPGEVAGLLGRNGAGKTTLINIAIGLISPDSGDVRAFGLAPPGRPGGREAPHRIRLGRPGAAAALHAC